MMPTYILHMFGRSPIRPLQEHINKVYDSVQALQGFFLATVSSDWQKAELERQKIAELEREADQLKMDLRLHLPKNIFMPFARSDVLELLSAQDALSNRARDIAGLMLGRKMHLPKEITDDVKSILEVSIKAALKAKQAIGELEEVSAAGFQGKELDVLHNMINELDKLEHDSDTLQIVVRNKLFAIEKNLSPVDVIFFYKIVEWFGDLADRAHRIGGKILILLAN
jgi:uncharacterized protein